MAISTLLKRLRNASFIQGSRYERNVLVQPGRLNLPRANSSLNKASHRIIDFGRGLGFGVNVSALQSMERIAETETERAYTCRVTYKRTKGSRDFEDHWLKLIVVALPLRWLEVGSTTILSIVVRKTLQ
jgi:hypothetical protein